MLYAKFGVIFLESAAAFLDSLDDKAREKILYNITKTKYFIDPVLLKKVDENIWEFRTEYRNIQYRLLAFWDKRNNQNTLVVAANGFIKKTDKIPEKEIEKAEKLRKLYFNLI